jgi:hypothetical protein
MDFRFRGKSEAGRASSREGGGWPRIKLQPKSFSISKQPRFAVGVGTLHLDFPSRMYLPRFGGAFLVWQRNQSPRPELLWCGSLFRECLLYPLISAPPLTPSQRRGFSCNMTANDNQISQKFQNWDPEIRRWARRSPWFAGECLLQY